MKKPVVHTDIVGQAINTGDTVVTNMGGGFSDIVIATVIKANPKTVTVEINRGYGSSYTNTRRGSQCLVLRDNQLTDLAFKRLADS